MTRHNPPSVFTCLLLLFVVDVGRRRLGLAAVLRVARIGGSARSSQAAPEMIATTLRRVLMATTLYPGRSQCLEQSVTSFILLRRRGIDVQLRLGVQPYPFAAHAWLDYRGVPVTESAEVVSRFAVLPEIAL